MSELPIVEASECLCARCARVQLTCCQKHQIYCTPGDVKRIDDYTGSADHFEYRPVDNPQYADQEDDPNWRDFVFRADGTRRVLRWKENGDCRFLGERGCSLPTDVRPLICRLYPFDYLESGILPEFASGCPTQLLGPGEGLIEAIGMSLEQAKEWHRQLYEEIRLETVAPKSIPVGQLSS